MNRNIFLFDQFGLLLNFFGYRSLSNRDKDLWNNLRSKNVLKHLPESDVCKVCLSMFNEQSVYLVDDGGSSMSTIFMLNQFAQARQSKQTNKEII